MHINKQIYAVKEKMSRLNRNMRRDRRLYDFFKVFLNELKEKMLKNELENSKNELKKTINEIRKNHDEKINSKIKNMR